ncbi:MAG TPA: FkbM family methyltransferase [Verrucomicrobiae bacterium]|nr:FkbM family methyltransferase [Verrucomicrobiae bacterium]
MIHAATKAVEKVLRCRIFRDSLPRGADMFFDLERHFGSHEFKTIFDIGANVGQSARAYHRAFSKADVYCFEPVSETFDELKKNTATLQRVRTFHFGFGRQRSTCFIHLNNDSRMNSILHNETSREESIEIQRVDEFVETASIGFIDLMKVDTEGFELEVLGGAERMLREHRILLLHVECEPLQTDQAFVPFTDLIRLLRPYGYDLFGIYDQQPFWLASKHTLLYFNALFISPELAKHGATPESVRLSRCEKV